ncbi:hypothetical protein IKF92_01535 [Candidatus Saccharibacteria bacterium]|nr:hypothetical protein [Candidatus Saccharibacteria bacterium]
MNKYIVKYEERKTCYDPYVTPGVYSETVTAHSELGARRIVSKYPGCEVLLVSKCD